VLTEPAQIVKANSIMEVESLVCIGSALSKTIVY
jgi:hypothetical protein